MNRAEQQLHLAVADFLDVALPADALWKTNEVGGKRTRTEAAILKRKGVRAGDPDIEVLRRGKAYFIELKSARGRLTLAQLHWFGELNHVGCVAQVCRSIEEVESFLRQFMPLRATAHSHPQPAHEYLEALHAMRER